MKYEKEKFKAAVDFTSRCCRWLADCLDSAPAWEETKAAKRKAANGDSAIRIIEPDETVDFVEHTEVEME